MEKNKYELEIVKLSSLVKELRDKQMISQEQLAVLCDVDVRTIQRIEKGTQNISIRLLFSIAESLKIKPHILVNKMFSHEE